VIGHLPVDVDEERRVHAYSVEGFMLWIALVLFASTSTERLVISNGMRLRAAPSKDAAIVEKIPIGTVLECSEMKDGFCRTKTGWYFAELTAPVEADREAQMRRLIEKKTDELSTAHEGSRLADLYEFHRFLLQRIETAPGNNAKLRAKLDELRLVSLAPHAFHADPRVYRDEAQGPRLKRDAMWALVDEAKGTPIADDAAWMAVQHGHDFECEGYAPCVIGWLDKVECEYLRRFPEGAHAKEAVNAIEKTLKGAEGIENLPPEDHVIMRNELAKVKQCAPSTTKSVDAVLQKLPRTDR
jgi:hypothetical protein